jgi:hypothetical protein
MAIVAIELHWTVRPAQIVLQMYCVIQLDRAGITAAAAQGCKFRMAADEASYVRTKM